MRGFGKPRIIAFLLALLLALTCLPAGAVYAHIYDETYEVNDFTVPLPGLEVGTRAENCWAFAQEVYRKLWDDTPASEFRASADDMLRDVEDDDLLTLSVEHLRTFVGLAEPGTLFRLCMPDLLYGDDEYGHSQILLQKDENGFTVYEGDIGYGQEVMISYYTWGTYEELWGRYTYIKYIKAPGVKSFYELYTAKNAKSVSSYSGAGYPTEKTPLYDLPWRCEDDPYSRERCKAPEKLTITGRVENSLGELWYRVKPDDGMELYIPACEITVEGLVGCTREKFGLTVGVEKAVCLWSAPMYTDGGRAHTVGVAVPGADIRLQAFVTDPEGDRWAEVTTPGGVTGYLSAEYVR